MKNVDAPALCPLQVRKKENLNLCVFLSGFASKPFGNVGYREGIDADTFKSRT
jgi:hypothetical protein